MLRLRLAVVGAFIAALSLAGPRALAQDPNEASAADVARARSQFEAGVAAARSDRWEDARRAFEESYRLSPRPATLLNLAGAQAHTSHLVEAARNYRAFLASEAGVDAQVRNQAMAALDAVERRIGRVQIALENVLDSDVVTIDGLVPPRSALSAPLPIEPGDHVAAVTRMRSELTRQPFSVAAGELASVTLHIERTLAPPVEHEDESFRCAIANPNRERDCPEIYARRSRSVLESPWFWVGVGVVTVAVVVTVILATSADSEDPYQGNLNPGSIRF